MKFTKRNLDAAATLLGLISGVSHIAGLYDFLDKDTAGLISGIAVIILGYLTNKTADISKSAK